MSIFDELRGSFKKGKKGPKEATNYSWLTDISFWPNALQPSFSSFVSSGYPPSLLADVICEQSR